MQRTRTYILAELGGDDGAYNAMVQDVMEQYAKSGKALDYKGAQRELVAMYASERLFTNQASIESLIRE